MIVKAWIKIKPNSKLADFNSPLKSSQHPQWFQTREEFLPREELHEFREGISTS